MLQGDTDYQATVSSEDRIYLSLVIADPQLLLLTLDDQFVNQLIVFHGLCFAATVNPSDTVTGSYNCYDL
jgi:hypothetical protein